MIFGTLLTSSNYNDDEKKITGGRNGYGSKLTNVLSTYFSVECADHARKKIIFLQWRDNMSKMEDIQWKPYQNQKDYVQITFRPDFKRFNMDGFNDHTIALFRKRVYDLAGVLQGVDVYLDDELIPINNFQSYANLYFKDDDDHFRIHHK